MGCIYVARHGQTGHNAQGVVQGPRIDAELNEEGRRQAGNLGTALAGQHVDAVYSSPLKRARQTAEIVADAHPGRPAVQVVPELYEMDYGELAGRPLTEVGDDLEQVLDAWRMGFPDQSFPGGESAVLAQHRVHAFAVRLRATALGGSRVLVVGHGRINRVLLATLLERSLGSLEEFPQTNAGLSELRAEDGALSVVRLDDTSHLGDVGPAAFS